MNKFEIVVNTAQGFLSYILVRDMDDAKTVWHHLRANCGLEVIQGGWKVFYPHLQISSIRLIGACVHSPVEPEPYAVPTDFPRPNPPQGGSGMLQVRGDTERLNRIIRWAINTHNGEALLEWVGGRNLRQLGTDVYKEFREKLDNLGV